MSIIVNYYPELEMTGAWWVTGNRCLRFSERRVGESSIRHSTTNVQLYKHLLQTLSQTLLSKYQP